MLLARVMRWLCSANSVSVISVISGAPIMTPEATDPASIPIFSPRDDAILAEIGSNTDIG